MPHVSLPVRIVAFTVVATLGCTTGAGPYPTTGLSARAARVSDAVVARDLAHLAGLAATAHAQGAAAADPATAYRARRAELLFELAREAYLRNDEGQLTAWLVDAARQTSSPTAVSEHPAPRPAPDAAGVAAFDRDARWAALASLQSRLRTGDAADAVAAVELEEALLRRAYVALGGPRCTSWDTTATRLAAALAPTPVVRLAAAPAAPPTPVAPAPVVPVVRAPTAPAPATPPAPPATEPVVSGVHFALDRSEVRPASALLLDRLVALLDQDPSLHVLLVGHTDQRASVDYNRALSDRRVQAVWAYLLTRGVAPTRIRTAAEGKMQLLTPGRTAREHAMNRRVSVTLVHADGRTVPNVEALSDLALESPRVAPLRAPTRHASPPGSS